MLADTMTGLELGRTWQESSLVHNSESAFRSKLLRISQWKKAPITLISLSSGFKLFLGLGF